MAKVFVCEDFYPELEYVIRERKEENLNVVSFPEICINKRNITKANKIIDNYSEEAYVVCSRHCEIRKIIQNKENFTEILSDFFCSNLTGKGFLRYIAKKGGYILGAGWLNNWKKRIKEMGFDQKDASKFFKETCNELVFFDTGIDEKVEEKLNDLSTFLDMPYIIIKSDLTAIEEVVDRIIKTRDKKTLEKDNQKIVQEFQFKQAEYASIINILGELTSILSMKEVKEKMKEIFTVIMGAKEYSFYENIGSQTDSVLIDMMEKKYEKKLQKDKNTFYISLASKEKLFGVIKVSDFLFPEYINKYYNFAVSIAPICILAMNNIENYEELIKRKEKLEYISYHDGLTGLCNRAYIEAMFLEKEEYKNVGVFSIDIDGLKDVNDKFGHFKGDELIIAASKILTDSSNKSDIVARVGGDEFVIIVLDSSIKELEDIKERIKINTDKKNSKSNNSFKISISLGYAYGDIKKYHDYEILSKKADYKMYKEKRKKKEAQDCI